MNQLHDILKRQILLTCRAQTCITIFVRKFHTLRSQREESRPGHPIGHPIEAASDVPNEKNETLKPRPPADHDRAQGRLDPLEVTMISLYNELFSTQIVCEDKDRKLEGERFSLKSILILSLLCESL